MKLRCVIVDDEKAARELLEEMLSSRTDIEVTGAYGDGNSALEAVRRDKPDLLFLDVQMPGMDGFATLDELGDEAPPVVFVTAYEDYAVQAFDVCAIDYVLKPLDEDRVNLGVDRAIARLGSARPELDAGGLTQVLQVLKRDRDDYLRYLPIRVRNKVVLQKVEDISLFEADGKNVRLHIGSERYTIRQSMQALDAKLDDSKFVRVSRSAIINLEHLAYLEPTAPGEWLVVLRTGQRVESTRGYRQRLQRLLKVR